jgi:DNA-binding CsgD family transcriptional regulator
MPDKLSKREKQVAAHLAAGLRVAGVASELCIAEITVRNHLRNIFSKLDIHSQSELIAKIRREPELVGAYRGLGSAGGLEERPLREELESVEAATAARLDGLFDAQSRATSHPQTLKAVLRAVLPLDEERRREWRTRLAVRERQLASLDALIDSLSAD